MLAQIAGKSQKEVIDAEVIDAEVIEEGFNQEELIPLLEALYDNAATVLGFMDEQVFYDYPCLDVHRSKITRLVRAFRRFLKPLRFEHGVTVPTREFHTQVKAMCETLRFVLTHIWDSGQNTRTKGMNAWVAIADELRRLAPENPWGWVGTYRSKFKTLPPEPLPTMEYTLKAKVFMKLRETEEFYGRCVSVWNAPYQEVWVGDSCTREPLPEPLHMTAWREANQEAFLKSEAYRFKCWYQKWLKARLQSSKTGFQFWSLTSSQRRASGQT
jgi:hypothetical protein